VLIFVLILDLGVITILNVTDKKLNSLKVIKLKRKECKMKKALLIAVVALASTSAHASKARETALANSRHLSDIQDVVGTNTGVTKPDKAVAYGEWATLEFGPTYTGEYVTANNQTAGAEGGFVRMMGNSAIGAYLGAPNTTSNAYRTTFSGMLSGTPGVAATTDVLQQENPLRLFYATKAGDLNWGAELYYSSSKAKSTTTGVSHDKKQDAMGVTVSASADMWDAQLGIGLSNNTTDTVAAGDNKLTGKSTLNLSGGYKIDTMYVYGNYGMTGAKADTAATTSVIDRSDTVAKVGIVDSHKKDGTDFFYGIEYQMATLKEDATTPVTLGSHTSKVEKDTLPLFIGIEAEAASWLVLRGSISQNLGLLGLAQTKTSTDNSTDATTAGADNTTVAAGAGIKFNKFTMDGVIAASSNAKGNLATDGNNFLTNVSLTYMF
jgi:hypothetical protein